MSEVEALDRSRRRMLLGLLIGFGVWQSVSIAKALVGGARFPRGVYLGLMAVSLAGGGPIGASNSFKCSDGRGACGVTPS